VQSKPKFITALVAAGAAAVTIAAAPMANADATPAPAAPVAAAPAKSQSAQVQQSCTNLGGSQTQCQSAGNVQIYDAPPQVNYFPLGDG
jgi:hypothetical protein